MGSSVHQSPARICAKFRLKKSRSIKPCRVLSLPFGQEKIQQSNIRIPKMEDILIMCNLSSLAKCWKSSEHVGDLLQVGSEVLVIWQDSDCWFSNQWHGSPKKHTRGGILRLWGSIWVPSSSASLRQRWSSILKTQKIPTAWPVENTSAHNGLAKQVGGWIHTSLSLKGLYNEVGNLCPTFLRKKTYST